MASVADILSKSQFTTEIGGVDFVLRRMTPVIAMKALGSRVFGMAAAHNAKGDIKPKASDEKRAAEMGRKLLEACMVSPRLGEDSNDEMDVIGYDDLLTAEVPGMPGVSFADAVSQALMKSGGDAANFTKPSGAPTEAEQPNGLTPSDSGTEFAPQS